MSATLFTGPAFRNKVLAAAQAARDKGETEVYLDGQSGPKVFLGKEPKTVVQQFADDNGNIYVGSNE